MATYPSKIGPELAIPALLLPGVLALFMAYDEVWSSLFITVLVIVFISHMFLTTYYQIDGPTLIIRCGFIVNKSIPINSITKITKTRNPMSSPATSLDRLEISFNRYDSILISPKDRAGFVHELKTAKPDINIRL